MSDESQVPPRPPTANKRTPAQRVADLQFIEKHALRGHTLRQIAALLAKERPYVISHAQIGADLKKLKKLWLDDAKDMVGVEKDRELRKLDTLEIEAWDAWDRSKLATTRSTLTKKQAAAAAKTGEAAPTPAAPGSTETKSAVQVSQVGNPVFLDKILGVIDRRAKLLGLDAPTKSELTGAGGGPIFTASVALDDASQEALLRRHFERQQEEDEAERVKNANDDTKKPTSAPSPA